MKRGTSRGRGSLPTGEWRLAGSGLKLAGTGNMRHAHAAGRIEGRGEATEWAAATVPGGGVADEQGPSGSGRGREEWGADRRD
jgi:hypothetical protein